MTTERFSYFMSFSLYNLHLQVSVQKCTKGKKKKKEDDKRRPFAVAMASKLIC